MKTLRTYSLEWLDSLISVTLNPSRPYLAKLQEYDLGQLSSKVPGESQQVKNELVDKIFSINKESQVRHLVRKYHIAIKALQIQAAGYKDNPDFSTQPMKGFNGLLIASLEELLHFIEERFGHYITQLPVLPAKGLTNQQDMTVRDSLPDNKQKVLCNLSGDQIALILRGADEAQVLKARSMNAVFKAMVPYLSTAQKQNLSASAIRSKAYNPEEADRDAAVAALEAIIRKIKSY